MFFIFFVCTSRNLVLFFFQIKALVVEIFNITSRCFFLNFFCEVCFHFFVFFIFRFDFVIIKNEVESRNDEKKNNNFCDLKAFFKLLSLLFFLSETKNANDEEKKNRIQKVKIRQLMKKKSKLNKKESNASEKKLKIDKKKSKITKINTKQKTKIIIEKVKNKNILLILLCFLIAFLIASIIVTIFRLVLLCFFLIHNFFFVKENLKSFTNIFVFIFVKTLYVLITFFVKLVIWLIKTLRAFFDNRLYNVCYFVTLLTKRLRFLL